MSNIDNWKCVHEALSKIYERYGSEVLGDINKIKSLLRDFAGNATSEINMFHAVISHEHIRAFLTRIDMFTADHMVQEIEKRTDLSRAGARRVVIGIYLLNGREEPEFAPDEPPAPTPPAPTPPAPTPIVPTPIVPTPIVPKLTVPTPTVFKPVVISPPVPRMPQSHSDSSYSSTTQRRTSLASSSRRRNRGVWSVVVGYVLLAFVVAFVVMTIAFDWYLTIWQFELVYVVPCSAGLAFLFFRPLRYKSAARVAMLIVLSLMWFVILNMLLCIYHLIT